MPAYLDLDDLEDRAIHLSDITMMISYDLAQTHPELVKELKEITGKILKVSRAYLEEQS